MKVEEKIGKLIKVDDDVELVTRRQFARIYVQVDMTKSFFLEKFRLHKRIQKIEYEGIHLICFSCRVHGHRREGC